MPPRFHERAVPIGLVVAVAVAGASCGTPKLCLAGAEACERAPICDRLTFTCDAPGELFVGRLRDAPEGLGIADAEATGNDLMLKNDRVAVAIDAIDEPHDLAATGGSIIDMGPVGGADDIVVVYQLAGILPDDAFAYRTVEIIDDAPERVALVFRGTLFDRPDVEVVTRYELRSCEPGVRVRSELYNGSPDFHAFIVADASHWGKRNALPFAAVEGQGFFQPELDLIELGDSYFEHPYVLARPVEDAATTYGFVACSRDVLEGVNDTEVSALGTARTLIRPGETLVLERFITASDGADLESAIQVVSDARRQLHGDPEPVRVTGRITDGELPIEGSVRRAVVLVSEVVGNGPDGALLRPVTTVVPGADGVFAATVPAAGPLRYEVWSFGRPIAEGDVPAGAAADVGDIAIPRPGTVSLAVTDATSGEGLYASVFFHPPDDQRDAVTGSWFGRFDECAPWLGAPVSGSPACNRGLVDPAGTDVELPAGRYDVYATAGPDRTVQHLQVEVTAGETTALAFTLAELAVRPAGWLAADLHVHGRRSFDSSLPDVDRVTSFVAAGVDVIAATDHDVATDYADAIDAVGVADRVFVMGGVETTQLIPHLDVPDSSFPKVIGHFNFWPLRVDDAEPRGGVPWDELIEPGELFDTMEPLIGAGGVAMMNHPWDESTFGRDLGYLRAIGYDPRVAIPDRDDGTSNGMLQRRPGGGHRNVDFNAFELQNGAGVTEVIKSRVLWFSLLSQGFVSVATANSDSHSLTDNQLGYGRTTCDVGAGVAEVTAELFNQALIGGHCVGGNGVLIIATVGAPGGERTAHSTSPVTPAADATLDIEVRAPPWVPVAEVRVITSGGEFVVAEGDAIVAPDDPFGSTQLVRFTGSFPLSSFVAADRDDWLVVEAGLPFYPTADLEDDGVPDTGDNDGDGAVDEGDIEDDDDDSGPLNDPPDPIDDADVRFVATRVVPGHWAYGFTNPFFIDRNGDGWDPPGLVP